MQQKDTYLNYIAVYEVSFVLLYCLISLTYNEFMVIYFDKII